jgi:dienelactone hydrolase
MRALSVVALAVLALAACGGSDSGADEGPPATTAATAAATATAAASAEADLFAFDRDGPLDVTEGETAQQPEFTAKAMSYASPEGDRVPGIVLLPKAKTSRAGVIFMHGAGGSRVDFLGDASELAKHGAVTLTIDSPFARSESEQVRAGSVPPDTAHELMVQNVKDLLRGLDVLVDEYDADPERLAVVGYSMGVQQAATAAALDDRVRAVVLIAGRANPSRTPGDAAWERQFRSIDTVHFAPELSPASVLLQGGERDRIVPRKELEALYAAASEPKELRWYDSGHEMNPKAGRDRVAWLSRELDLD